METPASAPEVVREFLARAIAVGATDIHFQPTEIGLDVFFRLDGMLNRVESLPMAVRDSVVARLKVLSNLLTYRTDIPQDGRLSAETGLGSQVSDSRVSVFPTIYGERVAVRMFYRQASMSRLDQLGLLPAVLSSLQQLADASLGVILVTGPAGSGKTTTLYALIRAIRQRYPGKSIHCLEDPVEQRIEEVTQTEIATSLPFPAALRSVLRQDPEVLMVGEIRDAETASIAMQAGLTGHLVLSTVHSSSPVSTLIRLLEMGIEPYQLTSSIIAVVNQRLVRLLCEKCDGPSNENDPQRSACEHCFGTGYRGRTAIAEMLTLDGELRRALLTDPDVDTLKGVLRQRGHLTLRQAGKQLVAEKRTSEEEILRVCGTEESVD